MADNISDIAAEDMAMNATKYATKGVYEGDAPLKGKKNPYQRATSAGVSKRVSLLNQISSTGAGFFDLEAHRPSLDEREMTMEQVRERQTEKSPTCISLFTGGGGMLTGFAMSGWRDVAISEFVNDACETIALNYNVHMIRPSDVKSAAIEAAEQLGIEVLPPSPREASEIVDLMKLPPALVTDKNSKYRGQNIIGGVAWEDTMYRVGNETFTQLRELTNEILYKNIGEHNPDVAYLWGDDIRAMSGIQMLKFMNIKPGEIDCIEGGPPCASFSMAGKREKGWGSQSKYSEERIQSTRNLFDEYIRVVGEIQPKMFIAENVPSLASGEEPRKYATDIIRSLSEQGYRCEARTLVASDYECVQRRERLFIQGVRNDLVHKKTGKPIRPSWPTPSSNSYFLRDALEVCRDRNTEQDIEESLLGDREIGRTWDVLEMGASPKNKQYMAIRCHPDEHCPTITVVGARDVSGAGPMHPTERRKFTVPEYMAIFGYPTDYQFSGETSQKCERMARSVPPVLGKAISAAMRRNLNRSTLSQEV